MPCNAGSAGRARPDRQRVDPANARAVLAAAGAGPADVVRLHNHVVNHTPDKLGIVAPQRAAFCGDALPAANTWIGGQALAMPEFLIEIEMEATAALP